MKKLDSGSGEKVQIFEIVLFHQLKKEIIFFICVASLQIFLLIKIG